MVGRDLRYAKLEAHGAYTGLWKTDLMGATVADCPVRLPALHLTAQWLQRYAQLLLFAPT